MKDINIEDLGLTDEELELLREGMIQAYGNETQQDSERPGDSGRS